MEYFIRLNNENVIIAFIETDTSETIPDLDSYKIITKEIAEQIKANPNAKLKFEDNKIEVVENYEEGEVPPAEPLDVIQVIKEKEAVDLAYQLEMEGNINRTYSKLLELEKKLTKQTN